MYGQTDKILIEKLEGGVAVVTLNKPQVKNAMCGEMMLGLTTALLTLDEDAEVRTVVLKGSNHCFCSGGDLTGSKNPTLDESRDNVRIIGKTTLAVQQMDKPVIAMVEGYAIGGGMSLALACDIIFASEEAKFACNFMQVGLAVEMGAMLFLPMLIGGHRAKDIWFTGRRMTAEEGKELGFVNRVFPQENLEEETIAYARMVADLPKSAVRITKRITNATLFNQLGFVLAAEAQNTPFCSRTDESKEYLAKHFLKKNN